ncbi:MAG: hypothetical protein ACTSYI_08960, partial [Promethearchaeota archaeon]
WHQYYDILNKIVKKGSRMSAISNEGQLTTFAEFVNILYHELISEDKDILPEDAYSIRNLFSNIDERFNSMTMEQFNKMDEIIIFFAQLFSFTDVQSISDAEISLTEYSAPHLSELEGFNLVINQILDKYSYFTGRYEGSRLGYSGTWIPFIYRLGNLDLSTTNLLSTKNSYKWSFPWPTPGNPQNSIIKGYMSQFEGSFFKYLEYLQKSNGGAPMMTNFHSSKEFQSLMHASIDRFEETGQIDFSLILLSVFPMAYEYMGAGRTLWVNERDRDYGVSTVEKILEQIKLKFPSIAVAYDTRVYDWYKTDPSAFDLSRNCPVITNIQNQNLVKAMALVYHPDIRPFIEAISPTIYENLNGDPLKIALYLLNSEVEMPMIDWNTGEAVRNKAGEYVTMPFFQLCGFSNSHVAKIVQMNFGLIIIDSTLVGYTCSGLENWWKNRDVLIECLRRGSWSYGGPDFQAIFELITSPM